MKKFYLFLLTMMVSVVSVFAEATWQKPASPAGEDPVSGNKYYIMNVEAGQFMVGKATTHTWATTCGLANSGQLSTLTSTENGWTIQRSDNKYTFRSGADECHVDMNKQGHNYFDFTKQANGTYTIASSASDADYAGKGFWGYQKNAAVPSHIYCNSTADNAAIEWIFVSEAGVATYNIRLNVYDAAMAALAQFPDLDLADELAIYNDNASTADQLNTIIPAINVKKEAKGDYTAHMSNSQANWTGASGVYGGGAEKYTEAGLPEGVIMSQTISNLPTGIYEVKFYGIANVARILDVAQWAGDEKAYVFANDEKKDITIGTKDGLNEADWTAGEHTITVKVVDGTLKYGIANNIAAGQWYVVKAISLTRTGDLPSDFIALSITEGEGTYTVTSTSETAALYTLCKPYSWLDEGETPESYLQSEIEGMASMIDSEDTWEMYGHMGMNPAPKTFTVADYEAMYSGQDMFIIAANVGWNGEKLATISNIAQINFTVPNTELVNASFDVESDWATENVVLNPATKTQASEWTISAGDSWCGIATFGVGSKNLLNNANVPTIDALGKAEGGVMGVAASWGGYAAYQQKVTLPAGIYNFTYSAYEANSGATAGIAENLCGVIVSDKVKYMSKKTAYTLNEWTTDEIIFELAEKTEVTISLGYKSNSITSNSTPKLFIDNVTLTAIDPVEAAKAAAIASLPVGDESIFTPSAKEVEAAKAAIEAATTVEEVEAATPAEYEIAALNGEYMIYNTTAENYFGTDTTAVVLSAAPVAVTFEAAEGGFYIKAGEEYINMKGGNTWSMSADAEAKTVWNFNLTDGNYTIQGPNGLVGSDNTEAGSSIYGNKKAENNGVWTISAYVEPMEIATSLMLGEEETSINAHSAVSVDAADAIKVNVINAPQAVGVTYLINEMNYVEEEEGSFWTVGKELASGEANLNGIAYAELDSTLYFAQGTKYQVSVSVVDQELNEIAIVKYEINGSYAEPMEIATSLILGEEETSINDHSAVSVDAADAIKVNVINAPQAVGVTYLINEMNYVEEEEGSFWTVGKELASGEANLNGIAYAELDSTLYFAQGTKYQVSVSVVDQELNEIAIVKYEINGSYAEPMEIATSLMLGEEETSINDHSAVSVDAADAIKVNVINAPQAVGVTYLINEMNYVEEEEGSFWTVGKELASGEANLNGIAYAELDSTLYFAQGTKYQVSVSVVDQELNEIAIVKYEINGAYAEPMEIATSLMLGEEETSINDHSAVSVDAADAIKVNVINAPEAVGVTYLINEMNYVEEEEGSFWTVGKELASGEANLNGIAYAELDSTLYFAQGTKYQVSVSVLDQELNEIAIVKYEINGSYAEPMEIATSLMLGEEETSINDHSAVSVDAADAIKVNVINAPQAVGVTYLINEMNYVEEEEGSFWTVGKELASGEANLNGIAYAELDSTLYFAQGTKYQVSVSVLDQELNEIAIVKYEINGSYAEPMEIATSLIDGEEEITINDHSIVSVEKANAIKVNVINAPEATGISYEINKMVKHDDEEGTFWTVGESIAAGESNLNTIGYAEFEETIRFNMGTKYQITVTVYDQNGEMGETFVYEFNGAYDEETVGIDAIEAEIADGKYIINGQVVIVKGGVKYNAAGQIVR